MQGQQSSSRSAASSSGRRCSFRFQWPQAQQPTMAPPAQARPSPVEDVRDPRPRRICSRPRSSRRCRRPRPSRICRCPEQAVDLLAASALRSATTASLPSQDSDALSDVDRHV
eukprot:13860897-Heterocapsa_arctica.AAC.1